MRQSSTIWVQLFVLAAGIALITMHTDVSLVRWIVIIIGGMFALPSLLGIIRNLVHYGRDMPLDGFGLLACIGGLILGVAMIVTPESFVAFFVYVLAGVLVLSGICQIWSNAMGFRPIRLPWWLYIIPVLTLGAGCVIIFTPLRELESMFLLVAGIAMVCSAFNGLLMLVSAYEANRQRAAISHS